MKTIFQTILLLFFAQTIFSQSNKIEITQVNSVSVEYAPSVSADGKVMIFQSNRSGKYELFESRLSDQGQWSEPKRLQGEINTYGTEHDLIGGPSISYDGNRLYFFASFEGGFGSEDIYYSDRTNKGWSKPVNIGKTINSSNYEGFPNISSDGKSLYFMRLNKRLEGNMNCYTLLVSMKDKNGKWQDPKPLPKPVNLGCDKYPRIMPDNRTLIFSSIREGSMAGSFDLYEAELSDNGEWTNLKSMTFSNSIDHDFFSAISSRFDKMYTIIKDQKGYDIYSYDIPLEFKPQHKIVNIQGKILNDDTLPVSAKILVNDLKTGREVVNLDNNASSGEYTVVLGEGVYDFLIYSDGYKTHQEQVKLEQITEYQLIDKDIVLTPFTQTVSIVTNNLRDGGMIEADLTVLSDGKEIILDNISFTAKYGQVYEITARQNGYEDVISNFSVTSTDSTQTTVNLSLSPQKPEIKVMPRDSETGKVISVNFMLKDLTRKKTLYKSKLNNDTIIKLDFNSRFRIYAVSKNHLFVKDVIDLKVQSGYEYIEYPLELQPIQPGAKLTLKEIYFEFGSAELDKSSFDELAEVYNFLKYNKSLVVEISAHTDNVGSDHDNMKLSEQRAQSVVDFLLAKGVPTRMLEGRGYGETQPIESNNTKDGRAKNRRVEFKVLKVRSGS